jgi:hypothetical protein
VVASQLRFLSSGYWDAEYTKDKMESSKEDFPTSKKKRI